MMNRNNMKAAVLTDAYKVVIKDVERPTVHENDVLIRVKSTGVCGSDLYVYRGVHPFRTPPAILGHELSGVVEETGEEFRSSQPWAVESADPV